MADYGNLSSGEIAILKRHTYETIENYTRLPIRDSYWLAIYSEYLEKMNSTITFRESTIYLRQQDIEGSSDSQENILRLFKPTTDRDYSITLIDSKTGIKVYDYLSELCEKFPLSYNNKQAIAIALTNGKQHRVKVIQSGHDVWIVTNDLNSLNYEDILVLIPQLFGIDELIKDNIIREVQKAVHNKQSLETPLRTFLNKIKDSEEKLKINKLERLIKDNYNTALENINNKITSVESDITYHTNTLKNLYSTKHNLLNTKLGIITSNNVKNIIEELLTYIKNNKYIMGFSVAPNNEKDSIELILNVPITLYDPEPLKRLIDNVDNAIVDKEQQKVLKVLGKIFVDKKYQMMSEVHIKINLQRRIYSGSNTGNDIDYSDYKLMPNPHLAPYNCWGDNEYIIDAQLKENLVEAINTMIIATQNINFADFAVVKNWAYIISSRSCLGNMKSFKNIEDGKLYSIKEIGGKYEIYKNNE